MMRARAAPCGPRPEPRPEPQEDRKMTDAASFDTERCLETVAASREQRMKW